MTRDASPENGSSGPDIPLEDFWNHAARTWQEGFQRWHRAWQEGQDAWWNATAPLWQQTFGATQELQRQAMRIFTGGMPRSTQGASEADPVRVEALGKAVAANLETGLRAFTRATEQLAEQVERAEPHAVARAWAGLAREYARDLEGLPRKMVPRRTDELMEIATELLSGQPGERAGKYLERFVETLRVKMQRGPDYFADPDAVGVGRTPRTLVHREGRLRLYRYGEGDPEPGRPPLVLLYSLINRPWILDLIPGFSLVEHLLSRGVDVWLVEWEEAEPGCEDTLDDYIDPLLHRALARVRAETERERVHLFGWCMGGTLALLYAALYPHEVASLTTLTTPVTSTGSSVLELWIDTEAFPVEAIVEQAGLMPGKTIRASLVAMKPYQEVLKWKSYFENLHDDRVMALFEPVDRWSNDNPDLAGAVFMKFMDDIYRDDRLLRGESTIHGRKVDLEAIEAPYLNLVAEKDWIVPAEGAAMTADFVGSEHQRTEIVPGPHVGIIMHPRARPAWDLLADFVHDPAAVADAE